MPQIYGKVNRALPGPIADGLQSQPRLSKYGSLFAEVFHASDAYTLADEGSYFTAMSTTPGTAYTLTAAAQAAFSATQALVVLRNTDAEGAKRIYLDFVRIVFATGGTAGTRIEVAVAVDNVNRYSSGGTAVTIANANMDSSNATIAGINVGAVTAAAASGNVRYTGRGTLSTAIPAIGETHSLDFGGAEVAASYIDKICRMPPTVIGGGDSIVIHLWLPSQSAAPTGEILVGWWER
jgi:hypothetical protein